MELPPLGEGVPQHGGFCGRFGRIGKEKAQGIAVRRKWRAGLRRREQRGRAGKKTQPKRAQFPDFGPAPMWRTGGKMRKKKKERK